MLCDRPRRWEVCVLSLVSTPSRSGAKTRRAVRSTPGSSRVQTVIELDFDESEALCFCFFSSFFCFFFFSFFLFWKTLQRLAPSTPTPPSPNPPKPYEGGEEVCSVCQRRANVSAITGSPSPPWVRGRASGNLGGRGEGVWRLDTRSDSLTSLSLLIIVWWPTVVLKDVSLSIKKRQIQDFFFLFLPCRLHCFNLFTMDASLAFQVKAWSVHHSSYSVELGATHQTRPLIWSPAPTLLILPATRKRGCCGESISYNNIKNWRGSWTEH